MIWVHGALSGWGRIDLDVEEPNEVINFLVEHFGETGCIEGDVRAPTSRYSYRTVRRECKNRPTEGHDLFPAPRG